MPQWIALSPSQHSDAFYLPRGGYHFAAERVVTEVLLAELGKLLPHYALGFLREGEHYQPVALLGYHQQNLYVAPNGKWLCSYVPASLRGYPFALASGEQDKQQKVFALEAAHLSDDEGVPLFDEAGQLTGKAAQALEFLKHFERSRLSTRQASQALGDAGVIEPWPLQVEHDEGQEKLAIKGFYRISETSLNALEDDAYARLRGGPMALAHAQLFSMGQMGQLTERATFLARHAKQDIPEGLDDVFGEDDDFTFDFDH